MDSSDEVDSSDEMELGLIDKVKSDVNITIHRISLPVELNQSVLMCLIKQKSHRLHFVHKLLRQLWEIKQYDNSLAEILYTLTFQHILRRVQHFPDDLVGLLQLLCELLQLLDKNWQLLLDNRLEKSSHPNRSSATVLYSQQNNLVCIKNIVSMLLL